MLNKRPIVIEQSNGHDREYDIYSRLLKERIIFLDEDVSSQSASVVIAQLLFLQMEDPNADITMYINSPGGSINAGLAIVDTMNYISCDVSTVVIGNAASMGSVIASSGTKGKRYITENAEVMIHQPSGGAQGKERDIVISAERIKLMRERLEKLYSKFTGKTQTVIHKDCSEDHWFLADEAVKYGLVDEIKICI